MRGMRAVGAAVSALAVGGVLAGCDKPPPAITVWSGSDSVYAPAACWSFDSDSLEQGQCAALDGDGAADVATLPTQPGQTLGISVDPAVADAGWQVRADGQPLTARTLDTKYYRVAVNGTPDQPLTLQVLAGREAQVKGVFEVRLEPQSG